MNALTARYLIDAFAVNAEIDGMKAENENRAVRGMPPRYLETDFYSKATDLKDIANNLHHAFQQGYAE